MVARKYVFFWLLLAAFFGMLFVLLSMSSGELSPSTAAVCQVQSREFYPTNSRFFVTKRSAAYDFTPQPACWLPECKKRNNRLAFRQCENLLANDWNILGVNSMERYLNGQWDTLPGYNIKSLEDAIWYFANATAIDQKCVPALINLGVAKMQAKQFKEAKEVLEKAIAIIENDSDLAFVELVIGLTLESQGLKDEAISHYDKMRKINSEIERIYFGVAITSTYRQELNSYGSFETWDAMRSLLTFAYFSPVSIGEWALLKPATQDWFLANRYIVLRKILPPFVLRAASQYYRELIDHKILKLGDTQAKRYVAYNDRVARFLHNHLTQLVRSITAHNARPSYTYFGGYVPGAVLEAHTDRAQCEFTISLNVEQYPHNQTWLLSLDKDPLFDKTLRNTRPNNVKPSDEEKIADADLYAGDALLFMGRHLIHFRRGSLPEGQWTNQIFLHFVQEGFEGKLN